jgi:hypothetical protein
METILLSPKGGIVVPAEVASNMFPCGRTRRRSKKVFEYSVLSEHLRVRVVLLMDGVLLPWQITVGW